MNAAASYYDANGCLVTPEAPAVAPAPAYVRQTPNTGWNAGANSIDQLDGDVFARFTVPTGVTGLYMGFKGARARQTLPSLITHALYFERGLQDQFRVMEHGVAMTAFASRAEADWFEIRRVAGTVTYWCGGKLIYTSLQSSSGPVLVNACLYSSGDAAPSGTGGVENAAPSVPTDDTANPDFQGVLSLGVIKPIASNPNNPDYAHDWYWMVYVPAGSASMTITLGGADAAAFLSGDGSVGATQLAPSQFQTSPDVPWFYNANPPTGVVTAPAEGWWRIVLDTNVAYSNLTLKVSVP